MPPNYKVGDTVKTVGQLCGMTGIVSDYYPPDIEGHGGLTVFVVEIENPSSYLDAGLAEVGTEEHFAIWHPSQPWYSKCNGGDVPEIAVNSLLADEHKRLVNLMKKHSDWPERLWEANQKLEKTLAVNIALKNAINLETELRPRGKAQSIALERALANLRQLLADENPASN